MTWLRYFLLAAGLGLCILLVVAIFPWLVEAFMSGKAVEAPSGADYDHNHALRLPRWERVITHRRRCMLLPLRWEAWAFQVTSSL